MKKIWLIPLLSFSLTSCDTFRSTSSRSGSRISGADPQDRINLEEYLAVLNNQSRVLRLAASDAGANGYSLSFRYQVNGSGSTFAGSFAPNTQEREFPIVIDHSPRQPLKIGVVMRPPDQVPVSRFSMTEFDPAPARYPAYSWNPKLPNLAAGTQVVAVWPANGSSAVFDALDNTYRARLIVEIKPR